MTKPLVSKLVVEADAVQPVPAPKAEPKADAAPAPVEPRKRWRFVNNSSWWKPTPLPDGSVLDWCGKQEFVTEDAKLAAMLTQLAASGKTVLDGN